MEIREITQGKKRYINLLLIGDEQEHDKKISPA